MSGSYVLDSSGATKQRGYDNAYMVEDISNSNRTYACLRVSVRQGGKMSKLEDKYPDDLADVRELKPQEVVRDWYEDGIHVVVLRGGASWCAYFGLPVTHPMSGYDYDNIPGFGAHGGLTYCGELDGMFKGEYFYGWDYAHLGDFCWYDIPGYGKDGFQDKDHKWTIGEVVADTKNILWEFKNLKEFAERIAK